MLVLAASQAAYAATKPATATTLTVTSGGNAVRTIASGSVVTLTAAVKAGSTALTVGLVNFCDASAIYCTDIHILGTVQLTSAGSALLKFRPGIGSHSYKAVFAGTNTYSGSASSAAALTVTGTTGVFATTTSLAESGSWGNYTAIATVTEAGGTISPTGTVSFLDTSNGNSVLGTGSLGSSVAGISWPNPAALTMSSGSQAIAVGDFNGDGIPDLVVVGSQTYSPLVILLGNANGTYTTAPNSTVAAYDFHPLAIADFNGDGKLDIAGLSNDTETAIILLGNGDGTFTEASSPPAVGDLTGPLAVGDFNGDGIPDLAVGESSSMQIFLGNGDGTFAAVSGSGPASNDPTGSVVGDFNGDGKLDLAFTQGNQISVALGNGDGTFGATTSVNTGSNYSPLAVADFNGDGKLDLAVAVAASVAGANDSVTVLLGNGDGTFVAPSSQQYLNANSISAIQVGDFNGDGIPDLVVTDSDTNIFTAFLGKGGGTFIAYPTSVSSGFAYLFPSAVGDLNGDGRTDLVIGNGDIVSIFLTEPTETATGTANISLAGAGEHLVTASYAGKSNYPSSVSSGLSLWGVSPTTTTTLALSAGGIQVTSVTPDTVVTFSATVTAGANPVTTGQVNFCDASGTSCTDIHLLESVALTSSGTATFKYAPGPGSHSYKAEYVQSGYGQGGSSAILPLTVGPAPAPVYSNTTTLAYTGYPFDYSLTATVVGVGGRASPTGNISFLDTSFGNTSLGTVPLGAATAGLGWLISQTPVAPGNATLQVTADFNGDGIPDLAVLSADVNNSLSDQDCTIFFGKGDGTFTTGPTTQTQISGAGGDPPYLVAGDFNADGKMDLAILNYPIFGFADTVTTLLGNGDGTFTVSAASVVYNQGPVGGDGVSGMMVAADFNGDGKLDLAVVGDYVNLGGVTIVLGNGDGTFTAMTPNVDPYADFGLIATGDFNGDGIPDLVATNYFDNGKGPTIFLGKGDGAFTATVASFTLDYFPTSIVVGDFNGDGVLDLAFSDSNGVELALGKGDGTFTETAASPIPVPSELYSLVAGDFNHDGKSDLAGIDNYDDVIDLLIGAGDGTFAVTPATPAVSQDILGPFSIVAADFNQDGVPDLAMLTKNVNTATILLTEPSRTATATATGITLIGAGTHNVEASYDGDGNYASGVSAPIAITAGLAPLVFSPAGGTYSTPQDVTISEPIPGGTIYYQAYGTVNTNGFVPYTGAIQLNRGGSTSIQAYATENGYQQSANSSASYQLNLPAAPAPVFSVASGGYPGAQTVTITDLAPGATIYYSTNGALPTTNFPSYIQPLTVSSSETVVAVAIASGYSLSSASSAQYLIASASSSFIYTVAGNGSYGYAGDGGAATLATLNQPTSSVLDGNGNLYIADSNNNVIRKVAAGTGVITPYAGTGTSGYSGDNGPAIAAQLYYPNGLSLDSSGNLYFADADNSVVRMIAAATGKITTVAGTGISGYSGDGSAAVNAQLSYPSATGFDSAGNLYICDGNNDVIREVATGTGIISTVAGDRQFGYSGDGGPATAAQLGDPEGLAVDKAGNIYIADTENQVIRKVSVITGLIATVAGTYSAPSGYAVGGYSGDGGPAINAQLNFPYAVALDGAGNLYIADSYNLAIREVTATTGVITTVVGSGNIHACYSISGDGGPANSAALCYPQGVFSDPAGNLYIAEETSRIRFATVPAAPPAAVTATPTFSLAAGTYPSTQTVTLADATPDAAIYLTTDGTSATTSSAGYHGPFTVAGGVTIQAVAVAPHYLASSPVNATYAITTPSTTTIRTIAGNGTIGFSGAGGLAASAKLGYLSAMTIDAVGNLYFTDFYNNVVWKISASTGVISIVAGTGTAGYQGDGGPATSAQLNYPQGIAVDTAGNLYISDSNNDVVRRVNASTGLITKFAGTYGQFGYPGHTGDGGLATAAFLASPLGLALDGSGNLYIADSNDNAVRIVSAKTGIITTVAGNGSYGFSGSGGQASSAGIGQPNALAFDAARNLYIVSDSVGRICKVAKATGNLTVIAGNGNHYGNSGDGGLAINAEINPAAIAFDAAGNLYLGSFNGGVREVSTATGIITTVVGNGYSGYSGDGGPPIMAQLAGPMGIVFDALDNLYIADEGNARIREVGVFSTTSLPSTTGLTSSMNPEAAGGTITLTATVKPVSGSGVPTGTVNFSVDGGAATQATLDTGSATYSASSLAVGAHQIAAFYSGDGHYAGSSGSFTEIVDGAVADIAVYSGTGQTTLPGGSFTNPLVVRVTDSMGDPLAGVQVNYSGTGLRFSSSSATTESKGQASVTAQSTIPGQLIATASLAGTTATASFSLAATTSSTTSAALKFIPVTPCRVVDTRNPAGPFGGPKPAAGSTTTFNIPQSACNIPSTAVAYSLNVTVVPSGELDYLTLWPAGEAQPVVSTLNSLDGRIKANAAITPAGTNGGVSVYVSNATQVILDIDGYFVPAGTASALAFYPVTPCRIADTRQAASPLGGPSLAAASSRSFPILASACNLPSTAQAYSLNVTALPNTTLDYLTSWPTGEAQPNVSTLNATTGTIVANAAIVPAGTSGGISIYVSDAADVILDVNGYFAPAATGGLSLYTVTPCRALDTRPIPFSGTIVVSVQGSTCAPPTTAQAYVLNATVVPLGELNYLTLWPGGSTQPNVSSLNALDGSITSNMAIVPINDGAVDAFAQGTTNLILDISSYFAP